MGKFNIGDTVKVVKPNSMYEKDLGCEGVIKEKPTAELYECLSKTYDYYVDFGKGYSFTLFGENGSCRYYYEYELELVKKADEEKTETWKLVIEGCGDITTAKYIKGKKVISTDSVKRYHKDEYSPKAAAHAVIEKVFSGTPKESGFTGKAVCKKTTLDNLFVKGRIYTFEDGYVIDKDGDKRPITPNEKAKMVWFDEHFVAIVE